MLTREDLQAIEDLLVPKFDAIDKRFTGIDKKFIGIDKRFDSLENRMDSLEMRMEHMESDVSALKAGQLDIRKEIKKCNDRIDDVYNLALNNFGQIEESKLRLSLLEHRA